MYLAVGAVLVFLAVAVLVALAIRREMRAPARATGRVRLHKMMRRRGLSLPAPPSEAQARDLSAAFRRCQDCNHKTLCDEWLATGKGAPTFCPNATWLAKLRDDFLSFR